MNKGYDTSVLMMKYFKGLRDPNDSIERACDRNGSIERVCMNLPALMTSLRIITAHSASPNRSQLLMSTDNPSSSMCEAVTRCSIIVMMDERRQVR